MPEQVSVYRLEEEIAHGGMGIVYRGVHTVFDEVVAIKAIFPELTLNPELRERFLNEAKIQRRLHHPNIVQIREFLIDQGKFFIVMEFIEGETLANHLRRRGQPMTTGEAVELLQQALEGLGFAHAQGVIHRDIKPSNIILTREGVAKLTDFGIARAVDSVKLTRTGTALGTPAYMSPEQIQGVKLDHRTDIYSMGITLYEMLTGRVPFERLTNSDSDFNVLVAHINQTPPPPSRLAPGIPPFLEAAILKALEKAPANRFASCQEFQAALLATELGPTQTVVVPPVEPAKPLRPSAEFSAPPAARRPVEPTRVDSRLAAERADAAPTLHPEPQRANRQPAGSQLRKTGSMLPYILVASLFALGVVGLLVWKYASNPSRPTDRQAPASVVAQAPSVNQPSQPSTVPPPEPAQSVYPANPKPLARRNNSMAVTTKPAIRKSEPPAPRGTRPLSKTDVVDLLTSYVAPQDVAEAARRNGINFALTPAVERELRGVGANDELIATLRQLAPKGLFISPPAPHPLSKTDVVELLSNYVPPGRVAELAQRTGINFEVTEEVERELRGAGATDELIAALRQLAPKQ
jgi:serine/threonine-protein kinase